MEQIGLWAGFILTLMIFSYILSDNFLYRAAVYIVAGLTAGFIAVVTWDSVLAPWLNSFVLNPSLEVGSRGLALVPLVLGLLLLLKASTVLGRFGNLALAFLIAVGTAVALVGAVAGTLLPLVQVSSSTVSLNPVNGVLLVLGIVCTLVYFQYMARRRPNGQVVRSLHIRLLAFVGQGVIVITLGALYAAAIVTSLTIFSERVSFILLRVAGG